MAGDWIKMRSDLFTHPKVVRMASALKADTLRTVGGLMSVWCLFDTHSEDGFMDGYSPEVLDTHLRWDGFSAAMISVGWLVYTEGSGLSVPDFDTHNGQSAKRRAQDADRKREVRKASASDADKKRTREEKRREEILGESANAAQSLPTSGDSKSKAKTLKTYLAECKDAGIKPIPDDHFVRKWAEEAGLTGDMLQIAWLQFRERYTESEKGKGKRYKDWPGHFATAVKANWFKLWFQADDGMHWSSLGMTHKTVLDARMARQESANAA